MLIPTLLMIPPAMLAFFLIIKNRLVGNKYAFFSIIALTVFSFGIRVFCLPYKTLDYIDFLSRWVDFFRVNGGFAALKTPVGNYNVPYLYFLALFSYIPIDDLYLIKILSILFDVFLAYGVMKITMQFCDGVAKPIIAFFAVLLWPTVILNGSLWSQCDSLYVAFGVWGIYLAMQGKGKQAMVFAALSFSFKLQAIFILPVFAVFLFTKKIKWQDFLIFPLTYVIIVMPAVIAGRSFISTLTLYASQTDSIGTGLNYNSPSIYSLIAFWEDRVDKALYSRNGIIAAAVYMITLLISSFALSKRIDGKKALLFGILFAVGIPFLLPHMHDRYFFAADMLTLLFAVIDIKYIPCAILTEFASLLGYHAYLKMRYLLTMDYGAKCLVAVLLLTVFMLWYEMRYSPKEENPCNA